MSKRLSIYGEEGGVSIVLKRTADIQRLTIKGPSGDLSIDLANYRAELLAEAMLTGFIEEDATDE